MTSTPSPTPGPAPGPAPRQSAATIAYVGFETLDPDVLTAVYGPEQAHDFITPVPVLAARDETTGTLDYLPVTSRYAADPRWREHPEMEGIAPGWGYMGTGPGMAAAAILAHYLGSPAPVRAVQAFKKEVIAQHRDPMTGQPVVKLWLPGAEVARWVTERALPAGLLEFDLLDQLAREQAIGRVGPEPEDAPDDGEFVEITVGLQVNRAVWFALMEQCEAHGIDLLELLGEHVRGLARILIPAGEPDPDPGRYPDPDPGPDPDPVGDGGDASLGLGEIDGSGP
jgi:hypothetical protein